MCTTCYLWTHEYLFLSHLWLWDGDMGIPYLSVLWKPFLHSLQNYVFICYLSCTFLTTVKCQCLLFVLENYARWLIFQLYEAGSFFFPWEARRRSRFHHSVRLSIGTVIKKLPSLLKNMLCCHNHIVFCSKSRINSETKSLFDFQR